jgi:hypothetical protein
MHTKQFTYVVIMAMLVPMFLAMAVPNNVSAEPGSSTTAWQRSTLDKTLEVSSSVSIGMDSEGFIHASYYAGATSASSSLHYITNVNSVWTSYVVDDQSGTGSFNSMVITPDGQVWIAYYDDNNKDLKYARSTNTGAWDKGLIDSEGDVGRYNGIAVDNKGGIGFSYYDTNEKLKYAYYNDGVISTEIVGDMIPGSTSVSFFSDNTPVITYVDKTSHLTYAMKTNGTWVKAQVDPTPAGLVSSSTVTVFDTLKVAYYLTTDNKLRCASLVGGIWSYAEPDPTSVVSSSISLKVDFLGKMHIAYYDPTISGLKYANNAQGSWEVQVLDEEGEAGVRGALAISNFTKASIIYIEGSSESLKFITNQASRWDRHAVATGMPGAGQQNSLAIDANGVSHVAYVNTTSGRLYYANDATGTFVSSLIGNGERPNLVVDTAGKVYISYYDAVNKTLMFATNYDGTMGTSRLDFSTEVGGRSAVSLQSVGKVVIVYTQDLKGYLSYIVYDSGNIQKLDVLDNSSSVDVNSNLDMISDGSGNMYLTYFRSQHLYYATWANNQWSVPALVDDTGQFGSDCSITLGQFNKVYISYYSDGSTKGLKLATLATSGWSTQWVVKSDSGAPGAQNGLTLDLNGFPQIAYGGVDGENLQYSALAGGIWTYSKLNEDHVQGDISSAIDPAGRVHVVYFDEETNMLMLTDLLVVPSMPLSITASAGQGFASLSWTAPQWNGGTAVSGYVIYRGFSASMMVPIAHLDANQLQYNDTNLVADITVYYEVRATNGEGASSFSSMASATPTGQKSAQSLDMTLIAIIAIIAIAAVAIVILMLRRR